MRRHIQVTLALLLFCGLGWFGWRALRPERSSYGGRSVRFWFDQYYQSGSQAVFDSELHDEASAALQKLGTNAVAFLLTQALRTEQDSAQRQKLHQISRRLPKWCPKFWSYDTMRWEALQALREIKPPAGLVLPQLSQPLTQTNTIAYWNAIFLLGCLGEGGEQGVPILVQALSDAQSRRMVVQSLGMLGPRAGAAAPKLTELLLEERRSTAVGSGLVYALGALGSNAAPALPRLKALFDGETNQLARASLAVALCQIDAQQDEALAFLIKLLQDLNNPTQPQLIALDLGRVGPNAAAAVPALVATLNSPRVEVSMNAVEALKQIGFPREVLVAKLEENLQSNDETIRVNSAARILTLEPGNVKAQQELLRLVQGGSIFSAYAVESLGRAGAAAKAAVPALRQLLSSQSKELREKTQRAIQRIQSDGM